MAIAKEFKGHSRIIVITKSGRYEGVIDEVYPNHMTMLLADDPEFNCVYVFYSAVEAIEFKG